MFTVELDAALREEVAAAGGPEKARWAEVAAALPGRPSPEACRERFRALSRFPGVRLRHSSLFGRGRREDVPAAAPAPPASPASPAPPDPSDPPGDKGEDDLVVIHVCDDNRNVKRDFSCPRRLLASGMRYFESYLSDSSPQHDDVDISVHCDVHIFQWLMAYVKQPSSPPHLDARNVVSVLISSDFLKMGPLVDRCLAALKRLLPEVLASPIDLRCVGDPLVARLAALLDVDELGGVGKRAGARGAPFADRLFAAKVEALLRARGPLRHCCHCGDLFAEPHRAALPCAAAAAAVGPHGGGASGRHQANRAWNVNKYLLSLRARGTPWKGIYWHLWGVCHALRCAECGDTFVAADLDHCSHHTRDPLFPRGENVGFYPCCDVPALRFAPFGRAPGCRGRRHRVPDGDEEAAEVVRTAVRHGTLVLREFRFDRSGRALITRPEQAEELLDLQQPHTPLHALSAPVPAWAVADPGYGQACAAAGEPAAAAAAAATAEGAPRPATAARRQHARPRSQSRRRGAVPRPQSSASASLRLAGSVYGAEGAAASDHAANGLAVGGSSASAAGAGAGRPGDRAAWKADGLRHSDRKRMSSLIARLAAGRVPVEGAAK